MTIKAIMFDLDGTLLTSRGSVSNKTIEAIRYARDKNIHIGICTGREAQSVKTLLFDWGLEGLIDSIVGTGGAEIYDFKFNIEENNFPLEGELIKEIMEHYKDLDVNFAIPYNGLIYAPKETELIIKLSEFDRIPYKIVNFESFLDAPKPKVMITCEPEEMEKVLERAQTFNSEKYKSASLKTASVLYEYMDPRISKTLGIQKILNLHNLKFENLCCFGDADNDYDMILNAGVGVVMGNGSEKTKAVADYITDDNDHDGIYNYITKQI